VRVIRLSDEDKKQILKDYLKMRNYCAVGKLHGLSNYVVKRVVDETLNKQEQKSQPDSQDKIDRLIDLYVSELANPDRLCDAPLNQVASTLGVIIDKFSKKQGAGQLEDILEAVKHVE